MVFKKLLNIYLLGGMGLPLEPNYTYFNGKKVGEDYFGNSYYESKDKTNRWCIYSNQSEASKISPEWNSWLRFISVASPEVNSYFS